MPIIAKEENVSEQPPIGMHQAVCSMVCDIGTHKGEYQGRQTMRHQIVIIWEINEKKQFGKFAGERFQLSRFYTLSLDQKATLRKDLQSWRGQPFTSEELKGFDIERLKGANCFLNVIHVEDKAKISAITPLAKGMAKIEPTLTQEPEWIAKMRERSLEHNGGGLVDVGHTTSEEDLPF